MKINHHVSITFYFGNTDYRNNSPPETYKNNNNKLNI